MSNISTLMDLLFGGARQRVLAALLLEPDASFHLRELARLTETHAGTLTRELDKLYKAVEAVGDIPDVNECIDMAYGSGN